jgi:hypothetical protein
MVPRPFATVAISIGPPLTIDGTADDLVEEGRRRLEASLSVLEQRCREMLRA